MKQYQKMVGSNITDAILQMADGSDHKSIDDFTLYEVMKIAIDGADRQFTNDVLGQLLEVNNHTFHFRKKVSVNMELMQSNAARMATYGIVIGIPQLTLTLLANIETATNSNYGREFRSAIYAIRKKYAYNHVHDMTSLQTILTELVEANEVRALKDAPAPNAGTAHSLANSVTFLNSIMNIDSDSDYTESAYGASSDSGSFEERRKSRERENKKTKKAKSREKRQKRRTRKMSQRRTHAPTVRNTTARSPSRQAGQMHAEQDIRDTASSRSAMSSR